MLNRCRNPNVKAFKDYGGRGITVCERWFSYENFLADMGRRPSPVHSIDRKDNDGNYEPSNCRWATKIEQSYNTRATTKLRYKGRELTLLDAARLSGVPKATISQRLTRGWTDRDAIERPVTHKGRF